MIKLLLLSTGVNIRVAQLVEYTSFKVTIKDQNSRASFKNIYQVCFNLSGDLYIYVPLLQCLVGKPEPEFLKIFK
jgi:hypothetical protein